MIYVGILDGKGDVWGVRIPDAPGIHGGGRTPQEAIADAASALAEATRIGHRVHTPRSIEALRSDEDVMADITSDDVFVLVEMAAATDKILSEV